MHSLNKWNRLMIAVGITGVYHLIKRVGSAGVVAPSPSEPSNMDREMMEQLIQSFRRHNN